MLLHENQSFSHIMTLDSLELLCFVNTEHCPAQHGVLSPLQD